MMKKQLITEARKHEIHNTITQKKLSGYAETSSHALAALCITAKNYSSDLCLQRLYNCGFYLKVVSNLEMTSVNSK